MAGLHQKATTILNQTSHRRIAGIGLAILSLILGLACKYYRGPAAEWVNNWGPASVFYETMFVFGFFFLWPYRAAALRIALGVLIGTCVLEFLQMWQPPWLQSIRATLFGRLLLGNSFSWWDLPAYFVGCALGWWGMLGLTRNEQLGSGLHK